ncbi:MAG: hypothetical protein RLZZ176_1322, partial [Cyanobacteriota bacterium]
LLLIEITVVFISLDQSKGEAFGQLIIGVYPRLSSECFAPTLFCKSSNPGYPDMANATLRYQTNNQTQIPDSETRQFSICKLGTR